jgi:hypothetical protein
MFGKLLPWGKSEQDDLQSVILMQRATDDAVFWNFRKEIWQVVEILIAGIHAMIPPRATE